jgi:hypothetical protein
MAISASLGNPIIVTGTTNTNDKVINKGLGGAVFVKFVYWYNPTTINHLISLKDVNGRVILPLKCEVANESQWAPVWSYFNSIYCDDMDSGTLYIYTR